MKMKSFVATFVLLFLASATYAQNQGTPASKAAAQVGTINIVNANSLSSPILTADVKTASQKDLFVSVSLESGLYTQTQVKSKAGTQDTSVAEAGITIKVLLDGLEIALPNEVVFAKRSQTLSARLGGVIQKAQDTNGDGTITIDEMELTDEEIELITDTMSADTFNFIIPDVSSGTHTLTVTASIATTAQTQTGTANATASIGNGSLTVEEVRLIKDAPVEF